METSTMTLEFNLSEKFQLRGPDWLMRLKPWRKVQYGPYLLDATIVEGQQQRIVEIPVIVDDEGLRSIQDLS